MPKEGPKGAKSAQKGPKLEPKMCGRELKVLKKVSNWSQTGTQSHHKVTLKGDKPKEVRRSSSVAEWREAVMDNSLMIH